MRSRRLYLHRPCLEDFGSIQHSELDRQRRAKRSRRIDMCVERASAAAKSFGRQTCDCDFVANVFGIEREGPSLILNAGSHVDDIETRHYYARATRYEVG